MKDWFSIFYCLLSAKLHKCEMDEELSVVIVPREKYGVVVYQKLESEDFEGCRHKNRIMNDMMETRCYAVTR